MDLLCVNAGGFRKRVYQELGKDYSAIETPFWAALTAGFIRNHGFEVDILDANAENLDIEESAIIIEEKNPRLVNIVVYGQNPQASTALMPSVGALCQAIKKKNKNRKIILTGLHPSALPKRTIEEEACDFVGEGEGFHILSDLLQGQKLPKIPSLWWREDREIKHNPPAPLIKDLDSELKDVAWDLLPMNKYKAHNWQCFKDLESRANYASISTSLGCPFNCDFCCINASFGKPYYRMWSPEWALKQIDILVQKYGIQNLKIIDELFVLKPEHFLQIAEGLIKREYKLRIWAYARIDVLKNMKEDDFDKLRKSGITWLGVGIESASQEIRGGVSKGQFNETDIKNIVKRLEDKGITVGGNYIFGLPDDTYDSMQKTLNLAIELNCVNANLYCAMAYPGSKLYEKMKGVVKLPDDPDGPGWIGYSQHSYETLPLPTKTLSAAEVLRFRDYAFNTYFTNPKYLNMIENRFGLEARKHIEEMTKIKLKRKLL